MESLIHKFTNKYILFYTIFKIKGLEAKENYLGRRGREKIKDNCIRFSSKPHEKNNNFIHVFILVLLVLFGEVFSL